MQSLRREFVESTRAILAFPRASQPNLVQQNPRWLTLVPTYQTWYGATREKPITSPYATSYSKARQHLSDSSYFGNWQEFFSIMDQTQSHFRQDWINCIRRGSLTLPHVTVFRRELIDIHKFPLVKPSFRVGTPRCIKPHGRVPLLKW
jgi:hypothetical protein